MAPIGKLTAQPHNPGALKILIAAEYSGVELETNLEAQIGVDNKDPEYLKKISTGKFPGFEGVKGFNLFESNAIAFYVANSVDNNSILGSSKEELAEVLKYAFYFETTVVPNMSAWVYPLWGYMPYNKNTEAKAIEGAKNAFKLLDDVLLHKTFLVGERVTLADIVLICSILNCAKYVCDAPFRQQFRNLFRHFDTCVNQPEFKKFIGDVELCVTPLKYTPPSKKETSAKPKQGGKLSPKKKQESGGEGGELDAKPAKKEKSKLDLLPPSPLNLEEWKRFYSNNNTIPTAMNWFWEHFDPEGYSIWKVDYKYNDELGLVFMSSNLIGGFFQRLERARKYAFGSLIVQGENSNNEIHGYFVIRGQDIPEEVSDAADFTSYDFTKVDSTDPEVRKDVEKYFAWEGDFGEKAFADGKIFK